MLRRSSVRRLWKKSISETKKIIGNDTRSATNEYADFIGKIVSGDEICTAFISGVDEVATAAHCFTEEDNLSSKYFEKLNGDRVKIDSVKSLHQNADVIFLNVRVGFKFLPLASYSESESTELVSFDVDGNQHLITSDGESHKVNEVIFHTFDTVSGASGSPIIQNGTVVGIHIGYFLRGEKNLAVSAREIKKVDLSPFNENLRSEFKIKIPKKIGGALGQISDAIKREISGKKEVNVCGYKINVPVISYALCQAGVAVLPVSCTAAAAATGGGSCAANYVAVATACTVSVATVVEMGSCCIKGGC